MSEFSVHAVGRVESPLVDRDRAPKQSEGAPPAWLVFDPAVRPALADLRVGDDVIVLTWLDQARREELVVHPRDDPAAPLTGVFSTRSADRPNPIGLHTARIVDIDDLRVRVDRLEAVDGTPIVDLKPVLHKDGDGGRSAGNAVRWGDFAAAAPELARYGAERLGNRPANLATVRPSGDPRVHPVTPIIAGGALFLFSDRASPKGRDLRERGTYALRNAVPEAGTGGEFSISGVASPVDDPETRAVAAAAASYEPGDRDVLFELKISEARSDAYGEITLPTPPSWRSSPSA